MQPTIAGRSAIILGRKYDLSKIIAAHEKLVDALTAHFGASVLTTDRPGAQKRIPWPEPGKAIARRTWEQMKELHDVVDEPLLHLAGGLTVKAFLLGKTWCVRNIETGAITTPEGEDVSLLDPVPTVCIYGAGNGNGSYRLVDGATMDAVSMLLSDKLRDLGLGFERRTINDAVAAGSGASDFAFITFPHEVYGAGRDWITVRCVNSDGSELDNGDLN
ncbi:MAG TPA: hypothetical protein VL500_02645 [Candidatus Eisenbacteria bacterium]|nr:hypothetical protein [Candidatus Eisenbacteria bacterium]